MAANRISAAWMRALTAPERPPAQLLRLEFDCVIPASIDDTFAFFSDAGNLEALTPPWLKFRILTPLPMEMHEGAEIDYRIALYGVSIPWRTRIDVWEPGRRFVDRQLAGPYLWWRHEHTFEVEADGTRVIDRLEFMPRAAWVSRAFVRRDVNRIFHYRQETLCDIFGKASDGRSGRRE